jgi:putative peptidoglycan lipid II flippase
MFSMNNILARAFFALNDIKTPMKISVFCLALNLGLAYCFVTYLNQAGIRGEAGLGIANTLSACCNLALLTYTLRRKLTRLDMGELKRTLLVLIGAAVVAGLVAALLGHAWQRAFGHSTLPRKMGAVFCPGAGAGLVYWLLAYSFKVPAAREVTALLLQKLRP